MLVANNRGEGDGICDGLAPVSPGAIGVVGSAVRVGETASTFTRGVDETAIAVELSGWLAGICSEGVVELPHATTTRITTRQKSDAVLWRITDNR